MKYQTTADIAKTVRSALKVALPEWKFSVTTHTYSMGASITVALVSGPVQIVEAYYNHIHRFPRQGEETRFKVPFTHCKPFSGYAQLNHYQLLANDQSERGEHLSNGVYLTPTGWEVMTKAAQILTAEHRDDSDFSIDYFSCNFYPHVAIGKWDREFQVTA